MNDTTSALGTTVGYLHLTVYLISGNKQQFVQTDAGLAQHILDQIRPERFYAQKHLLLSGHHSVTVMPAETIEHVELRTDPLPAWHRNVGMADLDMISEEEFLRIQQEEHVQPGSTPPPQTPKIGMQIEMRSGALIYCNVHFARPASVDILSRPTSDDISLFLTHLFSRPVLFGKTEDTDGLFLLNPANAVRFTIAPGPPELVSGAWSIDRVVP